MSEPEPKNHESGTVLIVLVPDLDPEYPVTDLNENFPVTDLNENFRSPSARDSPELCTGGYT